MSKTRKQYDREFKVMAVALGKGRSDQSELSKELEVRPSLLYRWRRELETKAETSFPGQGKTIYTPGQVEIHRLKKELLDMQQGRDILKKAMAFSPGAMANIRVHKAEPVDVWHRENVFGI